MYRDSTGRAPIHVNRITIIVTNIENINYCLNGFILN